MIILIDLIIINLAALSAFLVREYFLHYTERLPSEHLYKYVLTFLGFNVLYFFIAWLVGLYDKRQRRALLEEFALIFGVFLMCMAITLAFLFLGRLWWVSRIIIYLFWGTSVLLLCLSRIVLKKEKAGKTVLKYDLSEFIQKMQERTSKINLESVSQLTVILVNTNERDKLVECLSSIDKSGIGIPLEIIVVDNNSTDGTREFLKEKYPTVKIIRNESDIGYGRSINKALKIATSDLYLILNPDMIILPGALEIMIDYSLKHPKVGMVGCKLFNVDGSLQFSARRFLDLRTYLYRFTPLRGLMAGSALERRFLMQDWDHNDNRLVDWVLGSCMLVNKRVIDAVGMMDDGIFIYFDDVEWCYRMWDKGWQVAYVGEAGNIHKHIRTSMNKLIKHGKFETYEHLKSLFYFLRKYGLRIPQNCPSSNE